MGRRVFAAEQIINKLREAEVLVSQGEIRIHDTLIRRKDSAAAVR